MMSDNITLWNMIFIVHIIAWFHGLSHNNKILRKVETLNFHNNNQKLKNQVKDVLLLLLFSYVQIIKIRIKNFVSVFLYIYKYIIQKTCNISCIFHWYFIEIYPAVSLNFKTHLENLLRYFCFCSRERLPMNSVPSNVHSM